MERLRVKGRGPLAVYADGFAEELAGRGYSASAVRLRLWQFYSLSQWLEAQQLDPAQVTSQDLEQFTADRRARGLRSWVSARSLRLPVQYLRAAGVMAPEVVDRDGDAVAELLVGYRAYLVLERGLAAKTITDYEAVARLFLSAVRDSGKELSGLAGADVVAFARAECARRRTPSAQHAMSALRSLLRYLHVAGLTVGGLAGAVPAIAAPRVGLPKALGAAEVSRLLSSCDRNRPVGLRDYAILLLLTRLGLRTGEVAALGVADVDWRAGELEVRGKGGRSDRLPLPTDVGQGLVDYLKDGRVQDAGPTIFVRVHAPRGPLDATGIRAVVHDACIRAGMAPVGAHRLRHTAATNILASGGSLPQIAQVLRHRQLETTAIYAKVDHATLRPLALPWPGMTDE